MGSRGALILASLSPTRAKILRDLGIDFIQMESGFDEESLLCEAYKTYKEGTPLTDPARFAYTACLKKLESTCNRLKHAGSLERALDAGILCADSVVSVEGRLLRKARDKREARSMLEFQSAKRVSILTALAYESTRFTLTDLSVCHLELGAFAQGDLLGYVDSLAWQGKAGCVMVEGFHRRYIRKQVGLESCALGLSVEKVLGFIKRV